jgi:pimeloyl-ACP methyl ester carboxylesterase
MRASRGLAVAVVGLALVAPGARAEAAAQEQTWEGTLKVGPGVELRLVFHVTERDGGALSATMDSPDQGASDLPVDVVTRDKSTLTFEMKKLGARFQGKMNPAGTEAVGTFSQGGMNFPLTLTKSAAPPAGAKPAGNEQIWEGKLAVGGGLQLRLVLLVTKAQDGTLTARLDSPDEGLKGLKIDPITIDKSKLAFELKLTAAKYEGTLNPEGTESVGTWSQRGAKLPLTFRKTDRVAEVKRPQTPRPPFPYKSEDVTYDNKPGGVRLAGTLTVPEGRGPFPAALLISGSGAQDRDESLLGHKPFAVLADALTRRGIAVLRVDDRGVGGSSGSTSQSTAEDFAGDVLAGVAFLKTRREIDPKAIGLIGHSEGGLIGPMAATRSRDIAYVVMMAGTGLPGEEILYLQGRLIAQAMGASKEALDTQREIQSQVFTILKTEKDPKAASARLREAVKAAIRKVPEAQRTAIDASDAFVEGQLKMAESPWFRYFLTYDPRPTLAKVKCPVLALVGEKDLQVPPKENLSEIEKTLKDAGNRRVTVKELPGLNHLFQTCKTGSIAEYAQIEETIAPSALKLMGDWILDHVRKR